MAGYIFSISKDSWAGFCQNELSKGYFTPYTIEVSEERMSDTKRKSSNKVLAATFGDMVTMTPGDNIYFLSDRKLYGIGRAIQIGEDCKYDNYLDASALLPDCRINPADYLTTRSTRARWVFLFVPAPHLFKIGVDMDDVLRYRPSAFKMLRAFEGLTFIKIDDDENRALKEYIFLANEGCYGEIDNSVFPFDASVHERLASMDLSPYMMDINKALADDENREYVISEMFIESALLQSLTFRTQNTFEKCDYITHQLIASPFKPLTYIDKIDVFGYRFSEHYPDVPKLITKYILVELKKMPINGKALEQTMQYVDWICHEYASGDYSKIEAYVVGSRAVRDIERIKEDVCQRSFIVSTHPVKSEKWTALHLIKYDITDCVSFERID